jgi:hypothetical protein
MEHLNTLKTYQTNSETKVPFKPLVTGFGVASAVLVSDLGSINLGHEIAR